MNPNTMIYFNSLVLQHDFEDEARRSREGARTPARPTQARSASKGHDSHFRGLLHLALPGRR
jgi:hypothetical protein